MKKYLADTTVIIEHLRGNEKATKFLEKYHPYISIVTIAELIQGSRNDRERATALRTSNSLSHVFIDEKTSRLALELLSKFYLSHGLKFWDALIAASAIGNKLVLVSENIKHFRFITGLEVVSQETAFKKSF